MKIDRANQFVMSRAVVFCEIVSQINFSWGPIDLKFALGDVVSEPVEAHVDGFGSVLFGVVVEDAVGRAVVDSDRVVCVPVQ